MALVQEKKGGPYSKQEQEKRQNEVYRLHFEFGYPAIKIAKKLHVNRNTINSDINFCYSQLSLDWENQDGKKLIMKQLERFELQRSRLYEELEKCNVLSEKITVEKLILDVDQKISQIVTKLLLNYRDDFSIPVKNEKSKEDRIQKLVNFLVKKTKSNPKLCCFTEDEIMEEAVKLIKCDISAAEDLFEEMNDLGLCFYGNGEDGNTKYDILEFSKMRGY